MSDLFNEIFVMAENLQQMIEDTSDKEKQLEIFSKLEQLTQKIDLIASDKFKKNDQVYQKTMEKIKEGNRLIKKYLEKQKALNQLLIKLVNTFTDIDKMLAVKKNNYQ